MDNPRLNEIVSVNFYVKAVFFVVVDRLLAKQQLSLVSPALCSARQLPSQPQLAKAIQLGTLVKSSQLQIRKDSIIALVRDCLQ